MGSSKANDIDFKIRERTISESKDGNCNVCCEKVQFFAVGFCDHPVCLKCSARMRVLCNQQFCAACKAELEQVVYCEQIQPFRKFKLQNLQTNRKYGVRFENKQVKNEFYKLLDYRCSECENSDEIFSYLADLKTHLRKVHSKQFCDICMDNLTTFPIEMKTYTKKDLVYHRREGDKDERSHRGHPECRFCDDRFFDNDALLMHLRKNHFWCHFCEYDGKQDYFNVYNDLREHFRKSHYLCDEGNCRNEKFTSVFRGPIDFKAHKLAAHGKNLNKMQAKEARKVEIDYSFSRHAPKNTTNISRDDYEEVQRSDTQASTNAGRRRDGGNYSGGRKYRNSPVNFYDYDDIEKDRKVFKQRNNHTEEINDRHTNLGIAGAMAPPRLEHDQIQLTADTMNYAPDIDSDDDVIGLAEHINKTEISKSNEVLNESKKREETKAVKSDKEVDETDFPSLSGAKPVPPPNMPEYKSNEEAFPALQSKKADKSITDAPSKAFGNHVSVKVEKKKKGKSWSKQTGRDLNNLEDFPSLGKAPDSKTSSINNSIQQDRLNYIVSMKNKETLSKTPVNNNIINRVPSPLLANSKDFSIPPGLAKSNHSEPPGIKKKENARSPGLVKTKKNNPPPGLDKTPTHPEQPPPGLDKTLSQPKQPPPGLDKTASHPKQPPPGLKKSDESKMERNIRLLEMLQAFLDDFNFSLFKQLSGKYRKDEISAQNYYDSIHELLKDNLKIVFSELVALLPDEKKQQELLIVHNNQKIKKKSQEDYPTLSSSKPQQTSAQTKTWGSLPSSVVQAKIENKNDTYCHECGQSFPKENLNEHMETHSGEAFPALPVQMKKKKNYSFAPVYRKQVPVKNAWKAN